MYNIHIYITYMEENLDYENISFILVGIHQYVASTNFCGDVFTVNCHFPLFSTYFN